MSSNDCWIRPISFNRKNEKDQKRLKLVGKKAFGTFIKKLMDDEIERRASITIPRRNSIKPLQEKEAKPKEATKPMVNPMLQKR